jgi:hypothetical protein
MNDEPDLAGQADYSWDERDPFAPAPPEVLPNLDELVIEDGAPLESIFAEKQNRLLTETLYNSWPGPGGGRPFLVLADVGLFPQGKQPPLAPDVMLSLDVELGEDLSRKENRSYFLWIMGKPPNVVIEFVSDRRGAEAGLKQKQYARIGVTNYVIFDPRNLLGDGVLRSFVLKAGAYEPLREHWFSDAQIGLTLWEGPYEGRRATWLRWCDSQGQVIPTAGERIESTCRQADEARRQADEARRQADEERARRERLEARLRELGIEP